MSRSTGESRVKSLVGQEIDGRYRVDSVIARGGMGVVLRGTHLVLGQPVAIKVMLDATMRDANMRERFLREARILAQVRAPAIASIFDAGTLQDGTPYLVMELLEGEDLEQILARGKLGSERAARVVAQVCEGLAEAHDQGIVHRDLKPANVFVVQRPNGEKAAKIIDFGISKRLGEASETTGVNTLVGSPYYMAPEQVYASRDVDRRADIWSIGVILYRLVVGAQPFEAPTLPAILTRIKSATPTFPDDLDPDLVEVIKRCLEKDRAKRFQSALELRDVLLQFVSEGSRSAFALPLDDAPRSSTSMPRASRPSIPHIAPAPPQPPKGMNEPPRPPRMPSRPAHENSPPPARRGEVSIARPSGVAEALGAISIAESDILADDDIGGATLPGSPIPYGETDAFTEKRSPLRLPPARGDSGATPYGETDAFTEKVKPLARPRASSPVIVPTASEAEAEAEAIALRTSEIEIESDVAHDAKVTVPRMFPPTAAALKAATEALTRRAAPAMPPDVAPASVADALQDTPPDRMRIMSPAESWRPAWEGSTSSGPASSPQMVAAPPPSARSAQRPEPPLLPPVREQWIVGGAVVVAVIAILVVMLSQCGDAPAPPPPRKPVVSAAPSAPLAPSTSPVLVVLSPPPPDPVDLADASDSGHAK